MANTIKLAIIYGLLILFLPTVVMSQVTLQPRKLSNESRGIIYNKEVAMDLMIHKKGWAIGMNWGQLRTYYLTRFYYVSLGELKHPREFRVSNTPVSSSYVFGKQNNLFVIRAGIGEKRYLSEKARTKGVAVGYSYRGGATLGLLKPYYLEINPIDVISTNVPTRSIRYTPETASDFLDSNNIQRASGIGVGWSELRPTVGLNFMGSMHFGFGAYDEFVRAMDIGIKVDFFFERVPIMAVQPNFDNVQNKALFIHLFANFQLGKRS